MTRFSIAPSPESGAPPSLFAPPRNCWRVAQADRVGVLTNSHYFTALAQSMRAARHTIYLSGWDLDAQVVLQPDGSPIERMPFRVFLRTLLEARPELQVRVLLWNRTIFYGGVTSRKMLKRLHQACPRFDYRFVSTPIGASHHQKLVAIDDHLAYIGGIDLASDRWDVLHHPADFPRRRKPDGEQYGPIHDVQMAVEGPIASAAAELFRFYWHWAKGDRLPPPDPNPGAYSGSVWPRGLAVEFTDIPIAIARNDSWSLSAPVREVEALNRDALASARDLIYIETQYLTAKAIGAALLESLRRPTGPEIVIIVSPTMHGIVEHFVMGNNRDRMLRGLRKADRFKRLHVYYPAAPCSDGDVPVKIHAKMVMIDDNFLRIGSSNLNNRSLRLDTECDLALEAQSAADQAKIAEIRYRLIGELLCHEPAIVAATTQRHGSLAKAIAELDRDGRLKPMVPEAGPAYPMPGTAVLDPTGPLTMRYLWRKLWRRVIRAVPRTGSPATLRTSSAMANTTSPIAKGMKK